MDTTMSLTMDSVSANEDSLAFLALPAKRASEQIAGTENEAFNAIQTILNRILDDVSGKRTVAEFCAARDTYYPQYMAVMLSLGRLVTAVVPQPVINRLCYESMSEMEADFRQYGRGVFGQDICDQALFTIWTLRKINDLATRLDVSKVPTDTQADHNLVRMFVYHIVVSRFHLDCLKRCLCSEKAMYPEVLEPISEGLRSLVNAYAYIKQAALLRVDPSEEELINIDFDEEEQELMGLSMNDIPTDA